MEIFGGDFNGVAEKTGKENLDEHLILYCPVGDLDLHRRNREAHAFPARKDMDFAHGKEIDRLTFGMEYASFSDRRFDRKLSRYADESSQINHFVCLIDEQPVGNCDFFYHGEWGKIEDFDVVEQFQRRGCGSAVIEAVRDFAMEKGVKYLFLQVEKDNRAVEMYSKLGFQQIDNNIIYNKPVEEK